MRYYNRADTLGVESWKGSSTLSISNIEISHLTGGNLINKTSSSFSLLNIQRNYSNLYHIQDIFMNERKLYN